MKYKNGIRFLMIIGMVATIFGVDLSAANNSPYRHSVSTYQFPSRLNGYTKKTRTKRAVKKNVGYTHKKIKARRLKKVTPAYYGRSLDGHKSIARRKNSNHNLSSIRFSRVKKTENSPNTRKSETCPRCEDYFLEFCPGCTQQQGSRVMFCPSCDASENHDQKHHWSAAGL